MVIIVTLVIIFLIIIPLGFYYFFFKPIFIDEPGQVNNNYQYTVEITISGSRSNVTVLFPLPHDNKIFSCYDPSNAKDVTEYGEVMGITTSRDRTYYCEYDDEGAVVDPDLKFTTQKDDLAYVFVNKTDPGTTVKIKIYFEHSYNPYDRLLYSPSSGKHFEYIVIAEEPFITRSSTTNPDEPVFVRDVPYTLNDGWNKIHVQKGDYWFD